MRYWIGVNCYDHFLNGVKGGFCQLGHGRLKLIALLEKPFIISS